MSRLSHYQLVSRESTLRSKTPQTRTQHWSPTCSKVLWLLTKLNSASLWTWLVSSSMSQLLTSWEPSSSLVTLSLQELISRETSKLCNSASSLLVSAAVTFETASTLIWTTCAKRQRTWKKKSFRLWLAPCLSTLRPRTRTCQRRTPACFRWKLATTDTCLTASRESATRSRVSPGPSGRSTLRTCVTMKWEGLISATTLLRTRNKRLPASLSSPTRIVTSQLINSRVQCNGLTIRSSRDTVLLISNFD